MLLQQYNQCVAHMNALNPTAHNEAMLFHGTSSDALELINERGFDRSMAGKHATALGLVLLQSPPPDANNLIFF